MYINIYISICVCTHKHQCTRMFIAELFIKMSDELLYIYAIENNTAIQRDEAELYKLTLG